VTNKITAEHYPETMHMLWVINAPFFVTALWTIVKGFIDEKRRK